MQNRRSFLGAIIGGFAACLGVSRQAPASGGTSRQTFAKQDFADPFTPDDGVYLGLHDGRYLFADVQFHPENQGEVAFRVINPRLSTFDFYDVLQKYSSTAGNFRWSTEKAGDDIDHEIIICLSNCKIWRQPNPKGI